MSALDSRFVFVVVSARGSVVSVHATRASAEGALKANASPLTSIEEWQVRGEASAKEAQPKDQGGSEPKPLADRFMDTARKELDSGICGLSVAALFLDGPERDRLVEIVREAQKIAYALRGGK